MQVVRIFHEQPCHVGHTTDTSGTHRCQGRPLVYDLQPGDPANPIGPEPMSCKKYLTSEVQSPFTSDRNMGIPGTLQTRDSGV